MKKKFDSRLLRKIYFTKGARFTCHKRLEIQAKLSAVVLAWLSILVIAMSVAGVVFSEHLNIKANLAIAVVTIVLSFSIFVISVSGDVWNKAMVAAEMHRCATALNRLYDLAHVCEASFVDFRSEEYKSLMESYHDIIAHCPYNHHTADRDRFVAENLTELYDIGFLKRAALYVKKSFAYYMLISAHCMWAVFVSIFGIVVVVFFAVVD